MLSVKLIALLFIIIDYAQSIKEADNKEKTACLKPDEEDIQFWIQTVHSDNRDEWISEVFIQYIQFCFYESFLYKISLNMI